MVMDVRRGMGKAVKERTPYLINRNSEVILNTTLEIISILSKDFAAIGRSSASLDLLVSSLAGHDSDGEAGS